MKLPEMWLQGGQNKDSSRKAQVNQNLETEPQGFVSTSRGDDDHHDDKTCCAKMLKVLVGIPLSRWTPKENQKDNVMVKGEDTYIITLTSQWGRSGSLFTAYIYIYHKLVFRIQSVMAIQKFISLVESCPRWLLFGCALIATHQIHKCFRVASPEYHNPRIIQKMTTIVSVDSVQCSRSHYHFWFTPGDPEEKLSTQMILHDDARHP